MVDVYILLITNSQRIGELRKDLEAPFLAVMFHHLCLGVLLQWLLARTTKLRHELSAAVELFLNGAAAPIARATARRRRT
jgi:hypothetical protein